MKIILFGLIFLIAIGAAIANSHPDYKNNGISSPRFYASPPGHPQHP